MKKITLFLLASVIFASTSFAQTEKTAVWPELASFHTIMAATFHPAEEGNLAPLKEKVAELYRAAKIWYASPIPADFKEEQTRITLLKLNKQCNDIWAQVNAKASDEKLKVMITEAHETFHQIVGECKKGK